MDTYKNVPSNTQTTLPTQPTQETYQEKCGCCGNYTCDWEMGESDSDYFSDSDLEEE